MDLNPRPRLSQTCERVRLGHGRILPQARLSTNRKFLGVVERSRSAWRTKLYGFLDDADYKALADEPLAEAMAAYRRAEGRTAVIVVLVVVVMLAGSTMEAGWIDPNILRSWLATAHASAPGNP